MEFPEVAIPGLRIETRGTHHVTLREEKVYTLKAVVSSQFSAAGSNHRAVSTVN
jgi:hypothetical protein